MSEEKERVSAYLDTVSRLEPDIAISLKRIADALEERNKNTPDLWAFADKLAASIESGMFYGSQKK